MAENSRHNTVAKLLGSASLLGALSWFSPVVLSLLFTPVIVNGLGSKAYGLYALVLGFIGFSFNLNLAKAMTRRIAAARLVGDDRTISEIVGSGFLILLLIGVLGAGFLWLIADVYVRAVVVPESVAETALAIRIGGVVVAVLLVSQVANAVLQAFGLFGQFATLATLGSGGTITVNAILVSAGYGLVSLAIATLAVSTMVALLGLTLSLRALAVRPRLSLRTPIVWELLSYSKYVVGYQVLGNGVLLFERSVISRGLGEDALAFYVVPMMICVQFTGLVGGLTLFLLPAFAETGIDLERRKRLYLAGTRLVAALTALVVAGVALSGTQFLGLWLSPAFAQSAGNSFAMQMGAFGVVAISMVAFHLADGMGRPALNFGLTAVSAGVTVALMSGAESIEGFSVARLLGLSSFIALIPIAERKFLGKVLASEWVGVLSRLTVALGLFGLVHFFISLLQVGGWSGLVLSNGVGTASALGFLYRSGYFDDIVIFLTHERE